MQFRTGLLGLSLDMSVAVNAHPLCPVCLLLASGGTELPSREQPCSSREHVRNQCGKHVEESIGLAPDHGARSFRFPVKAVRMVTRNGEDSPEAARHSLSMPCLVLAELRVGEAERRDSYRETERNREARESTTSIRPLAVVSNSCGGMDTFRNHGVVCREILHRASFRCALVPHESVVVSDHLYVCP